MTKINYLLAILLLAIVGYIVIGQLNQATRTSYDLLTYEVIKKININIEKTYKQLKRYPDADKEFESLVLNKLNLHDYRGRIKIEDFKPGNAMSPASFNVKAGASGKEAVISLKYYGTEYKYHLLYKGKLARN